MDVVKQQIEDRFMQMPYTIIKIPGYSIPSLQLLEDQRLSFVAQCIAKDSISSDNKCHFCGREPNDCLCEFIAAYDEDSKKVIAKNHTGYAICARRFYSHAVIVEPVKTKVPIVETKVPIDCWMFQNVY